MQQTVTLTGYNIRLYEIEYAGIKLGRFKVAGEWEGLTKLEADGGPCSGSVIIAIVSKGTHGGPDQIKIVKASPVVLEKIVDRIPQPPAGAAPWAPV